MKQSKKYNYDFRGMRVYNLAVYNDFLAICKRENTNVSRELNRFIRTVVNAGTTEPRNTEVYNG